VHNYIMGDFAMRRILAHQHLVEQASAFMAAPERQDEFNDPAIPAVLLNVLHKLGLVAFNRATRDAITSISAGTDTLPFWDLIDATSFWEDTTPGLWPHMTAARVEGTLAMVESYRAGEPYLVQTAELAACA